MRVALELTVFELDKGGTARAAAGLLDQLRADASCELLTVSHSGAEPSTSVGRVLRGLQRELVYFPWQLPRWIKRHQPDVLHCLAPLAPSRSDAPVVVTVHDVIPWDHPEWLTRRIVRHQKALLPGVLQRASQVITSSQYSRDRLIEIFSLPQEKVTAVPLGIDSRFSGAPVDAALLAEAGVRQPFVLTVGTLQPRKNIESALRAFEKFVSSTGAAHQLVIAGARGWRDSELMRTLEASGLGDRVCVVGHVEDQQLVNLYRATSCFVFPSRYEGFGFPPLEAMACGTPVISSNRTSLPEVVGDAGILVDPDDVDQLAAQLERVLGSEGLQTSLKAAGIQRAAEFSWQRTATETLAVYERACAS